MSWALTIKDGLGTLGNTSTARLARTVFHGEVGNNGSVFIPDFDGDGGIITYSYMNEYMGFIQPNWWNNSSKILTINGGPYIVTAFMFRGARRYVSNFMGLTLVNSNNEVIIDNRNRNAEIVASGTAIISNGHDVYSISYPEVDSPMLFIQMPEGKYVYVGAVKSTYCKVSAQDGETAFNYFVAGFRRDFSGIAQGMALSLRRDGRVLFNSQRKYPRIYGCYGLSPNDAIFPWSGNPRTQFTAKYIGAPIGSYACLIGMGRAPNTGDSWWVWAYGRSQNVAGGGEDWLTRRRFTMKDGPTEALELPIGSQPSETLFTPCWSFIAGLS